MKLRTALALSAFATITAGTANAAIIISEYVEGSNNNKAIEIANTGTSAVDITGFTLNRYTNGSGAISATFTFGTASVAAGDVYVVTNSSANSTLLAKADATSGVLNHNGDDAYDLRDGTTVLDTFGRIGEDPGSYWQNGDGTVNTQNSTLVRKPTVLTGDTNGDDAFDPSVEYIQFDQDDFSNLGSHDFVPEPGSLALLGLGGLMIARRRRG